MAKLEQESLVNVLCCSVLLFQKILKFVLCEQNMKSFKKDNLLTFYLLNRTYSFVCSAEPVFLGFKETLTNSLTDVCCQHVYFH